MSGLYAPQPAGAYAGTETTTLFTYAQTICPNPKAPRMAHEPGPPLASFMGILPGTQLYAHPNKKDGWLRFPLEPLLCKEVTLNGDAIIDAPDWPNMCLSSEMYARYFYIDPRHLP